MHRAGLIALMAVLTCLGSGCFSAPLPEDVNVDSGDLRDSFRTAIINRDIKQVQDLLQTQPLLATAPHPSTGQAPIHVAAATGNAAIVRALLEAGADPYARNDEGESASELAQRSGASREIIDLLQ